jgi:hypothetical protein
MYVAKRGCTSGPHPRIWGPNPSQWVSDSLTPLSSQCANHCVLEPSSFHRCPIASHLEAAHVCRISPSGSQQPQRSKFVTQLSNSGWVISSTKCSFPYYGDSIVGSTTIAVGVHLNTQSKVDAPMFRTPPSRCLLPLSAFVWQPFNKKEYGTSFTKDDASFNDGSLPPLHAALPLALVSSLLPSGL